jgi:hypothetical protein
LFSIPSSYQILLNPSISESEGMTSTKIS